MKNTAIGLGLLFTSIALAIGISEFSIYYAKTRLPHVIERIERIGTERSNGAETTPISPQSYSQSP
jgi:hypothetical protein